MKNVNVRKLAVYELTVGMFVSELDCPVATTPFPVEGFVIRTAEQIRQIAHFCKYVLVDFAKSLVLSALGVGLQLEPKTTNSFDYSRGVARPGLKHKRSQLSKRPAAKVANLSWVIYCTPMLISLLVYWSPVTKLVL